MVRIGEKLRSIKNNDGKSNYKIFWMGLSHLCRIGLFALFSSRRVGIYRRIVMSSMLVIMGGNAPIMLGLFTIAGSYLITRPNSDRE